MNKSLQRASAVKSIIKANYLLKEENIKASIYAYFYYRDLKSFFNILYFHKIIMCYLKLKKVKYNE
jgi:hypothetical protein